MRLDELAVGWDAFERALEENGGELTDEAAAQLDALNLAEKEKVDGVVLYLRSLEGQSQGLKNVEAELGAKRQTIERRIAWLKERVAAYMTQRGLTVLRGEVWRWQYERNGGHLPMELIVQASDPAFPDRFVKPPPPPPPVAVDTDALRQALKLDDPEALTVARLVPGRHLQIR
jgi:hypothetical protein